MHSPGCCSLAVSYLVVPYGGFGKELKQPTKENGNNGGSNGENKVVVVGNRSHCH